MGLFSKKKPTPAIEFSDVEQGLPTEKPVVVDKYDQLLANQKHLAENQQVILDAITQTQQLIVQLATEGVSVPEKEEPSLLATKVKKGGRK